MTLRVAMIGYGFMGAAHSVGWRQAPRVFDLPERVETAVLVGRNAAAVEEAARHWGWAEAATDWREVIARDDIDVVDVVTPGDSHAEIAIAALDAHERAPRAARIASWARRISAGSRGSA